MTRTSTFAHVWFNVRHRRHQDEYAPRTQLLIKARLMLLSVPDVLRLDTRILPVYVRGMQMHIMPQALFSILQHVMSVVCTGPQWQTLRYSLLFLTAECHSCDSGHQLDILGARSEICVKRKFDRLVSLIYLQDL